MVEGIQEPIKQTTNKVFKQGCSFYSLSLLYLQNEDPIDFASVGV